MKLEGRIVDFLGDSITEGSGVSDIKNNRFDNRLKKLCALKEVYNYGIGGTRIAHQRAVSGMPRHDLCFCGRAYDLESSADIIVVFGGTNDYGHGDAPIGQFGDTTPATFYGAVWFLMNLINQKYAGKTVVFMTPAHRIGDAYASNNPLKQADALPLEGYVKIIEETAKHFDVHILNLMEELHIDPNNPEEREKYTVDGLHFNDLGHERIALLLKNYLESL